MSEKSIEKENQIIGNVHSLKPDEVIKDSKHESVSRIKLRLEDIQDAHNRIKNQIVITPIVEAKNVGNNFCKVFFKCENLQISGSFKARGVCNVITSMTPEERCKGCVISGGRNFLLAMTYYGFKESVPVTVILPRNCPISDRQRYKENYAIVKLDGNDLNEAGLLALAYCNKTGINYVRSSDRPDLLAGYGTLGLEILSQMEKLDAIICPVGNGGLIASVLLAVKTLKPNCLVYGVESSVMPTLTRALQDKKPGLIAIKPTIADSMAENIASKNAFNIIRGYLDRMITIDETWISRALVNILERENMLVEAAAACPLAALMAGKVPELRGKHVMCILSGGNINMSLLPRIIERGMVAEGRLLSLCATMLDTPGAVAKMLATIAEVGADVRSVIPEKTWIRNDVLNVTVHFLIEVTNSQHGKEVEKKLIEEYPYLKITKH